MRSTRNLALAAITCCAAACAAPVPQIDYYDVETEALERIRGMTIVDEASMSAGSYRSLGTVDGLYCDRNQLRMDPGADGTRRIAIEQVMLKAAILGAEHIGTPTCETRSSIDMTNNCMATVICMAEALVRVD